MIGFLCLILGFSFGLAISAFVLFRHTNREMLRIRKELHRQYRFQDLFFDHSPIGFFRSDEAGNCKFVNYKWCEMTGLTAEEAFGQGWARVLYPMDAHRVYAEWREMFAGKKTFDSRFRYVHKNGKVFWVWGQASPLYDEDGSFKEYFGSVVDISSLVEVSELLHLRERELESLLTSLEDVVFELNENNAITNFWTNDPSLLFLKPENFLGKQVWSELGESGEKIDRTFHKVMQTRSPQTVQYTSPDGSRFFEGRLAPIIEDSGEIKRVSFVVRDVTKIHQMQEQIEEQRVRALASSRLAALGEMAAGLAHEINNPIAIISAKCQLIERELQKENPSRERIGHETERIESTLQRISSIIRGLRAFARTGENDPFEWYSLNDILREIRELTDRCMMEKGIHVEWTEPESVEIFCRPVQVHQILVNLINNAKDALERTQEKCITIGCSLQNSSLVLKVANTGPRIPPEFQEKMWRPFFTTKQVNKGTGLGLSISLGLARDHQFELEYNANSPITEFQLIIPANCFRVVERSRFSETSGPVLM